MKRRSDQYAKETVMCNYAVTQDGWYGNAAFQSVNVLCC